MVVAGCAETVPAAISTENTSEENTDNVKKRVLCFMIYILEWLTRVQEFLKRLFQNPKSRVARRL